ncbi:MAG: DUF4344 domain-containing metallopeptidase [Thiolinea sp.]
MKRLIMSLIVVLSCFTLNTAVADKAEISYENPQNAADTAIAKQLQSAPGISAVVEIINDHFRLPEALEIVFGGDDGPLYDPGKNTIFIPYGFVEEVKKRFERAKYAETGVSIEDATMDVLMHTLFHELAHALINMYDLPVLGKEEDAADGLATVLLIRFFEDGQELAISAADLFDLESEDSDELSDADFWDEHSLDAQRYYATLCHVYGSDPEQYGKLLADNGFPADRAELCVEEYVNLADSWFLLLEPHMTKAAAN